MFRELLNEGWYCWRDENPFELVASVPANAVLVDLPYDVMLHEAQREDSVNKGSTGFFDGGSYKYFRRFFVDSDCRGERLALHFEGVYRHALVYINQSLVYEQAFGYSEFTVDIADYLRFGEDNEILVAVKCGTGNSRWYSGAGIYRNVWLLHGPALHIEADSLRVTTKMIEEDGALVEVAAGLQNGTSAAEEATVCVVLRDPEGKEVVREKYPLRIKSGKVVDFRKNVYVDQARLWDEDHPDLYTAEVILTGSDGSEDKDCVVTGIRLLTLDTRHGLRVNGKTVKLRGACVHHDQGILGAACYAESEYRRMKLMKEAGFNAIRSAHNHTSQAMLDACDRLGMFVMDELSDIWNKSKGLYDYALDFERDWEKDVRSIVAADYNHPSVVLYSTGNEISEIATEKGMETSRRLGDLFHQLDPTRYTTNGINGAFAAGDGLQKIVTDITGHEPGPGDVNVFMMAMAMHMAEITKHPIVGGILEKLETTMDVLGYNYMTARYLDDVKTYPDRMIVGSETNPKMIAENWGIIKKSPAIIGEFTWTGWDYMGEVRDVFPSLFNTGADISAIGVRRPMSYYREIVFGLTKRPALAVQDPARFGCSRDFGPWQFTDCVLNYTWPGQEGKPVMVEIYAGGDEVELIQNGRSLGRKACGEATEFFVQYDTVYEPGTLEVIAYENGKEIGRNSLATTGAVAEIAVEIESYSTETLPAAADLVFLDICLRDAEGRRVFRNDSLSIELSGPAKLLAFGSESALHDHGYEKPVTTATDGCALAVLKRTAGEDQTIQITFRSREVEKKIEIR